MTSAQYRKALAQMNLTQDAAAKLLGVSIRASHGYANGATIPETVARLLKMLLAEEAKNVEK